MDTFPVRCDHASLDEMEELTMPTNRIPKSIQSRTLAQSVLVNLVAQFLLSFSQPMLAQSQQKHFASAGQNSQVLNQILPGERDKGDKPTEMWSQAAVTPLRYGRNNLAGPKKLSRSQRKEAAYVDAMLSHL